MKHPNEFRYVPDQRLPLYGIGPIYVGVIAFVTALAILLDRLHLLISIRWVWCGLLFLCCGIALIFCGIYMWLQAVLKAKIDDGIRQDVLVTEGIYAWVRNPIYTAFLMLFTGILLINGNIVTFILPVAYWVFLTILLKQTEEKWLHARFGASYDAYAQRVNRVIPGLPHGDRLYRSDISDARWMAYDLPGNIGWLLYIICWVMTMKGQMSSGMRQVCAFGLIPAVMMVIGIGELLNERFRGLDRVLTRRRLMRGFGMLYAGGLAGSIVSVLCLVISVTSGQISFWTSGMLPGSLLCMLFAGLLYRRYQPMK